MTSQHTIVTQPIVETALRRFGFRQQRIFLQYSRNAQTAADAARAEGARTGKGAFVLDVVPPDDP
jgi:hypothetical protein